MGAHEQTLLAILDIDREDGSRQRPGRLEGPRTSGLPTADVGDAHAQAIVARFSSVLRRIELPTPFLVVDGNLITEKLTAFQSAFPEAELLYAVKANPMPEVLSVVAEAGAGADVASEAEIRASLDAGFRPERMSFGNTVKHPAAVRFAHEVGIRRFTVDSIGELDKVARYAPGASVLVRLLIDTEGAQWPLSRKFGCDMEMAVGLLCGAPARGLRPSGVAFHVGSQQTDPSQWDGAVSLCAAIDGRLRADGLALEAINIGGGFPAQYSTPIPSIDAYADAIRRSLHRHFGRAVPHIMIEPGRALVAEAGLLETSVLLTSRKTHTDTHQWVYLDCGKFGGLAETMDEAIRYPLVAPRRGGASIPSILAGPTCDSADILYERTPYSLPSDLEAGDRVHIVSAGAYTLTYASVGFNGFAPLRAVFL